MNRRGRLLGIVTATVLGMGLAGAAVAQERDSSGGVPASTSMERAGQDSEHAAKNAYVGTVTAVDDTTITTKVKAALFSGKNISSNDIHVTTTAGIVTLAGEVESSHMAERVESIARNTSGVRGVRNDLRISSPAAQN